MRLHEKFRGRNVRFISIAMEAEDVVSEFNSRFGILWPTLYNLELDAMNSLGVVDPGSLDVGMGIKPTIYILDSSGKVLWSDHGYRMTHPDVTSTLDWLELFIELALVPPPVESP